jgi:anti-sigma factor RsiW
VHTLVGAYALDALDADDRSLVEQHLDACDACAEEVVETAGVAAELAADAAVPPPASLRSAVLAQVAVTRQDPPVARHAPPAVRRGAPTGSGEAPPRSSGRRPWWWTRPLTVAAALLLAAGVGLGTVVVRQQSQLDTAQRQSEALDALASAALDSPASSPVTGGGRFAVVGVVGARGDAPAAALVVARDLPDLPAAGSTSSGLSEPTHRGPRAPWRVAPATPTVWSPPRQRTPASR